MIIVPFEPIHARTIRSANPDSEAMQITGPLSRRIAAYASAGTAFTAIHDGEVCGIAGLLMLWKGVAEAWSVLSMAARPVMFQMISAILRNLVLSQENLGLHRIQAPVSGKGNSVRFVSMFGFECESTMRGYGPDGSDYFMFVRLGGK